MIVVGDYMDRGQLPGLAAATARAAVACGAAVQVVGIVPGDSDGDRCLIELAADGVGHAAVLRSGSTAMEPADLELALRYLPDTRVVVLVGVPPQLLPVASESAEWAGATLIVVAAPGAVAGAGSLPDSAIELEAPASDPDGTFAGFVGALAARIDAGAPSADAWAATTRALAVDPV